MSLITFATPVSDVILRIMYAGFLAFVIGWEREIRDKPAGLKTHTIVGLASATLVCIGQIVISKFQVQSVNGGVDADPIRIIQAIIVGISFLGAGTIIRTRDGVEGLTTSASVLLSAVIGISVGFGEYLISGVITILHIVFIYLTKILEANLIKSRSRTETNGTIPPPGEVTRRFDIE